jgi:hypothetical protein
MSAEQRTGQIRRWLRRLVFLSARSTQISALLFLAGCAIPYVPYRAIYEDPVNYVRLEEDDAVLPEWPPSAHTHPKAITVEETTNLLRGFMVQERRIWLQRWIQGEAPFEAAFREHEIRLLAPQLAEALATAKPNERITYYLSEPQTSVKRTITTGGLYMSGTEMHFIVGNWQIVYGIPTYGMIYDRRYPMRPTAAKGFDLFFQPHNAVVKQQTSLWDALLANTKDELVIDLGKIGVSDVAGAFR